jgi:hypothetical protein
MNIITVQKINASIAKITNPINISKIAPINLNMIGNKKRPIIPKSIPVKNEFPTMNPYRNPNNADR